MTKIKAFFKQLWNDESGQGATEYILLLMVVVAIAFLFRDRISEAVRTKIGDLSNQLGSFTGDGGG